jgi:hypothetical protein
MNHKFAQVRPRIKADNISSTPSATIEAISGVQITGKQAEFTVQNGILVPGSGDATPINVANADWPNPLSVTQITGNAYYPIAPTEVKVTVGSITVRIDGVNQAFSNLATSFSQALTPGKGYTLTMDLRKTIWAGSNIYWDGSQLTFKPVHYVGEANYYQGVYFRWGSMVGMGAANGVLDGNMPVYYPTSANTWSSGSDTLMINAFGDYDQEIYTTFPVPVLYEHFPAILSSPQNRGRDIAYITDSVAYDYTYYFGDICQRIDPDYRMPMSIELGPATGNHVSWNGTNPISGWTPISFTAQTSSNVTGRQALSGGLSYGGRIFPASGQRHHMSIPRFIVDGLGEEVLYWNSSVISSSFVGCVRATSTWIWFDYSDNSINFYPIRCVKK